MKLHYLDLAKDVLPLIMRVSITLVLPLGLEHFLNIMLMIRLTTGCQLSVIAVTHPHVAIVLFSWFGW